MSRRVRNIVHLEEMVQALAPAERERFQRIFRVDTTVGELCPPPSMNWWIRKHFGSLEAVQKQRIVKVTNLITLESALFNELRARRPKDRRISNDLGETIANSVGDPFCQPLDETPQDVFGRVEGRQCLTASNVAKIDGFHGVVVFDQHNPLAFDAEAVKDYIDTALAWARKAHCEDKAARYFFFMWNCLWRSGSSILHGHAQMTLGRGMHYARVEHLRRAALLYRIGHGASYFDDLWAIHKSLDLAVEYKSVHVLAHLAPIKEKEVLLISERLDDDLKYAIYKVLRCFVNVLNVTSFNLAVCMRPIDSVPEDWQGFPVVVRVVDRGDPDSQASDMGAMDLYGSSVISSNPFKVAAALAEAFGEGR